MRKENIEMKDQAKFAYVCFTCKRDEPLLQIHYNAIKRADPEGEVYYQVEEKEANDIRIPEGAFLLPAKWSHNGNLCGIEALKGIIHTYKLIAENTNRTVVKIDSDTILISKGWLGIVGDGKADMIGFAPATGLYCKGTCYGISKKGIKAILDILESGSYWENSSRIEDGVITMLCAIGTGKNRVKILQNKLPDDSIILYSVFNHRFYNNPEALKRIKCVIDCGDPSYIHLYNMARLDPIEAKKRAMKFILHTVYKS